MKPTRKELEDCITSLCIEWEDMGHIKENSRILPQTKQYRLKQSSDAIRKKHAILAALLDKLYETP